MNKPFKYVVTCILMQKNGAGVHTGPELFLGRRERRPTARASRIRWRRRSRPTTRGCAASHSLRGVHVAVASESLSHCRVDGVEDREARRASSRPAPDGQASSVCPGRCDRWRQHEGADERRVLHVRDVAEQNGSACPVRRAVDAAPQGQFRQGVVVLDLAVEAQVAVQSARAARRASNPYPHVRAVARRVALVGWVADAFIVHSPPAANLTGRVGASRVDEVPRLPESRG